MTDSEHWSPRCVVCARRGRTRELDHGHVCPPCRTALRVDLLELVDLAATAAELPDPFATRPGVGGARPAPTSRPPIDLDHVDPHLVLVRPRADATMDEAQPLLVALEDWARVVREDRRLVRYGVATEGQGVTLATVVGFLAAHVDWMCDTPDFAVEDLAELVRRAGMALRCLDTGRERASGWRIPCPGDVGGGACGQRLSVDPGAFHDDLSCPRCGHWWTAQRLLLVALSDERVTVWAYPDTITDALGIPARTLREWAGKDLIGRRGSLYDAGAAFRRRHGAASA